MSARGSSAGADTQSAREQEADRETRVLKALRARLAAGEALGGIDLSEIGKECGVSRGVVAEYVALFRKKGALR